MRKAIAILALFCMLTSSISYAREVGIIAIIVPNDQATKSVSLPELKLIYLRKKDYWANGKHIHAVNLPADHPVRLQFSSRILGSLPSAQTDYWNGVYFHGISPPYVVNSEEAVVRYVADTNGAIGYVQACNVDSRVKAIAWLTENGELLNRPPELHCN
jgi:ABC-type phosphate transport system substrate-binding protein